MLTSIVDGSTNEIHKIRRLGIQADKLFVAFENGTMEHRMAHIASVDKKELLIAALLGETRHADEAFYPDKRCFRLYMRQLRFQILAEQRSYALLPGFGTETVKGAVVADKSEVYRVY